MQQPVEGFKEEFEMLFNTCEAGFPMLLVRAIVSAVRNIRQGQATGQDGQQQTQALDETMQISVGATLVNITDSSRTELRRMVEDQTFWPTSRGPGDIFSELRER